MYIGQAVVIVKTEDGDETMCMDVLYDGEAKSLSTAVYDRNGNMTDHNLRWVQGSIHRLESTKQVLKLLARDPGFRVVKVVGEAEIGRLWRRKVVKSRNYFTVLTPAGLSVGGSSIRAATADEVMLLRIMEDECEIGKMMAPPGSKGFVNRAPCKPYGGLLEITSAMGREECDRLWEQPTDDDEQPTEEEAV